MSRDREIRLDEIGKKIKREIFDATNNQMGIRRNTSFVVPAAATTLNTITPCAACKLLRRRCAEECPFSPYFSPHEPHKFAAVHKVFGASNVSKLLLEVPENQRGDAANSLVYEANLRLRDPIYGCMGVISTLQQEVQALQSELDAVRSEILRYKFREAATTNQHHHHHQMISSTTRSANLLSPTHHGGLVSIALPSQFMSYSPPPPTPPPPLPPPPQPPFVISSSSTSSASSLYTPSTSCTTGYSSISGNNVPFFD